MLLKHIELGKEDADVIHQSVLEADETASRDLNRMPDAGPAQGQQTKVPKANRGSAA